MQSFGTPWSAPLREEIIARNVAKLVKVPVPKYKVNRGLTVPQARAVLKAVRDIVGHSDIAVTMTIYAHVSLGDKRQALGKLSEILR